MKPQRLKAEIKNGKPTGRVVQTNKATAGAKTQATHSIIKRLKGQK